MTRLSSFFKIVVFAMILSSYTLKNRNKGTNNLHIKVKLLIAKYALKVVSILKIFIVKKIQGKTEKRSAGLC